MMPLTRLTAAVTALSLLVPVPGAIVMGSEPGRNEPGASRGTDSASDEVAAALERAGIRGAAAILEIAAEECGPHRHTPVRRVVGDFIGAHRRFGRDPSPAARIRLGDEARKVRCVVFRNPGSEEYVEALQYVNSLAGEESEAVSDLAADLQLHWQSEFGGTLLTRGAERVNAGAKAGLASAVLVLGTVLALRRPVQTASELPRRAGLVRKYFQMIRSLKPAKALKTAAIGVAGGSASAAGGAVFADQLHRSGLFDGDIPLAPAHIMGLGLPTDVLVYDYEYDQLIQDLLSFSAGTSAAMAAGLAVVRAAKYVNLAATPAKINPFVLVGSVAAGLLVEDSAGRYLEEKRHQNLRERVHGSRNVLTWGMTAENPRSDLYTYAGADALVRTSVNLSTYYNRDLMSAIQEYQAGIGEAAKRYGEDSREYQEEIDRLTPGFSDRVRAVLRERRFSFNGDYEAYLVRDAMMKGDAETIRAMGDSAARLARFYLNGFENWYLAHRHEVERMCFTSNKRREAFRFYMKHLNEAADRALSEEFRWAGARQDPNMVLMQAAAFIRNTKKPFLEYQAKALMNAIRDNISLVRGVVHGEVTAGGLK